MPYRPQEPGRHRTREETVTELGDSREGKLLRGMEVSTGRGWGEGPRPQLLGGRPRYLRKLPLSVDIWGLSTQETENPAFQGGLPTCTASTPSVAPASLPNTHSVGGDEWVKHRVSYSRCSSRRVPGSDRTIEGQWEGDGLC